MYLRDCETDKQIPLQSIKFEVDVYNSRLVRIQMKQEYINPSEDTPLETKFLFPVDIDFSLSKIRMDYENLDNPGEIASIETRIEERRKA